MPYVLAVVILILAAGVIGFALKERARKRRSKVETAARIFEDLVRLHLKLGALTRNGEAPFSDVSLSQKLEPAISIKRGWNFISPPPTTGLEHDHHVNRWVELS
jgi:hypothetical protein